VQHPPQPRAHGCEDGGTQPGALAGLVHFLQHDEHRAGQAAHEMARPSDGTDADAVMEDATRTQPEVRWDRMTAPALVRAARERTVVIIPLGATEQHGPHLPVQVDWRLAYEVS